MSGISPSVKRVRVLSLTGNNARSFLFLPCLCSVLFMLSCGVNNRKRDDAEIRKIDSTLLILGREIKYDSLRMTQIKRLIRVSDSLGYQKGVVEGSITGSKIFLLDFRLPMAIEMLETAKTAAEKANNPRLSALVNFYFGYFNARINNVDAAIQFYFKASQLSLEAGDSAMYAQTLMQTGNLYLGKGLLDKAREYLGRSVSVNRLRRDQAGLSIDHHLLGIYHLKKGELDSAHYYLETELNQSRESGNKMLYIYNLNNMASFNIKNGELDEGERNCLEALRLLDSIGPSFSPTSSKSVVYANLGLVNKERGNFQKAARYFNLAYADSLYNTEPGFRIELLYQLFTTYRKSGEHDLAWHFQDQYLNLRDIKEKTDAEQNLLNLEAQYNFKKLQHEHEQKQQRLRILLLAALVVIALGAFIIILTFQKQRIRKKNDALIKKLEEEKMERLRRELASSALNIVRINEQKNSLISTLRDRLPLFKPENQKNVSDIIAEFEKDKSEKAWKEFEIRFTEVHAGFYKNLSNINPHLTFNEKRLCAFLVLDMTTKEISSITGQSIRAIEQARIRLRKQLDLTNKEISLTAFLNSIL